LKQPVLSLTGQGNKRWNCKYLWEVTEH
jgi:hypothetical protein